MFRCGLFLRILESGSLFLAFLPCFLASVVAFVLLIFHLPKPVKERRFSDEDLHYKNCNLDYGAALTPTASLNSPLDSFY